VVDISRSGLVTIAGGKWTTYRKMAEDTLDQALIVGELEPLPCRTEPHRIHGFMEDDQTEDTLALYGSDARKINDMMRNFPDLSREFIPGCGVFAAEVVWAARYEMARTVADFLSRRRRMLILDAEKSIKMAGDVAALMARELNKDTQWERQQVQAYTDLAENYRA
jgi:glycerol-3-phosphate dehydrogenase